MLRCAFPALVSILQTTSALAQPDQQLPEIMFESEDGDTQRLHAAFDQLVEQGFKGYAVVSVGNKVIYARGQDSSTRRFSLDAHVDILSITKSMTGAAIGRLIVDGQLSADTRLNDIWRDVPPDKAMITVQQLLTHSSGMPHALGEDTEYIDRPSFLERAWSAPLLFEPGARYDYSNVGYSVLASIIERVTGRTYEQYLQEAVLTPAVMTSTGYEDVCCEGPESEYVTRISWGGKRPSWHLIGNGGLISTPRDMIRWINAYETGRLGAGIYEMTHQPLLQEGEQATSHYGFGLVVEDHQSFGRMYWHNGGSRAFNAHWRYYADHQVAIFVASDQREINSDAAEALLAKSILDDNTEW